MNTTISSIQIKRGHTIALNAMTDIPLSGEPIYDIDLNKLKIGDGTHLYVDLPYLFCGGGSEEQIVFANKADFPAIGALSILYVAQDEGNSYIWDGEKYFLISANKQVVEDIKTEVAVVQQNVSELKKDLTAKLNGPDADEWSTTGLNLPYYFSVGYSSDKATVTDYTVNLADEYKKNTYSLDIQAATDTTAGLMTAQDKVTLENKQDAFDILDGGSAADWAN